MKRKFFIIIFCMFLALSPLVNIGDFSYADTNEGGGGGSWNDITTQEEVVAAFKAYCNYRNLKLNYEPKTLKAIVNWNYNMIQKAASSVGVDLDDLNAHMWYMFDNNGYLRFMYDNHCLQKQQQIYAALLEDNNIEEDTEDNILYSGKSFTDDDGNQCFVFVKSYNSNTGSYESWSDDFYDYVKVGTPYRFRGSTYFSSASNGKTIQSYTINYNNSSINYYIRTNKDYAEYNQYNNICFLTSINSLTGGYVMPPFYADYSASSSNYTYKTEFPSCVAIIYNISNDKYYLGHYFRGIYQNNERWAINGVIELPSATAENASVYANQGEFNTPTDDDLEIGTDQTSINNYIINDSHDTYNEIINQNNTGTTSNNDNQPTNGTGASIDSDGNINFKMPNLNVDWNLNFDVSKIFPFSIANDLNNAFKLIDVESEAPVIDEDIHLGYGNWSYTWNFVADFSEYESLANIHRKWFLFFYVVMLIIATRSIMHIY